MGIDIRLFGIGSDTVDPVERLKAVAQFITDDPQVRLAGAIQAELESEEQAPSISVPLFPSCEPMMILAGEEGLVIEARTSQAGPGYHQHVCSLLDRLGEKFSLDWERPRNEDGELDDNEQGDETGYFWSRNRKELEEAMISWIRGTCQAISKSRATNSDADKWGLCMEMGTTYLMPGAIHGPHGPIDVAWMESVAKNKHDGRDFFPWWESGETPRVLLHRALSHMWSELRWRPPESEREHMLHHTIHELLEAAYRADASLPIPCREWNELLSYGAIDDVSQVLRLEIEHNAHRQKGPLIGYRRHDVERTLGNFVFRMPGSMGEEIEDDGTWLAFDTGRSIRMTSWAIQPAEGKPMPNAMELIEDGNLPDGDTDIVPQVATKQLAKRGVISQHTEDDTSYTGLHGYVCAPGNVALVTVTFEDPLDQSWAIGVWNNIRAIPQNTENTENTEKTGG